MSVIEYEDLEFENAFIYRECKVPLANQGLTLIRGLNLDDGGFLGAGKSSIFEMFSHLHIGKGGKRDRRMGSAYKSDMVNTFVGANLRARLRFKVDGHPYEVIQFKHDEQQGNKYFVVDRETGNNILPHTFVRRPHRWMYNQIMGLDETSFFNLVYLAQEFNSVMISGREKDRRDQLTSMFKLGIYEDMKKKARDQLKMQQSTMVDLERLHAELKEVNIHLTEFVDSDQLRDNLLAAKQETVDLQEWLNEKVALYKKYTKLHTQVSKRNDIITEVRTAFISAKFTKFNSPKAITATVSVQITSDYNNTYAAYMTTKQLLTRVRERTSVEEELQRLTARDFQTVQTELTEVKSRIQHLQVTVLPIAEQRLELEADLVKIGKPSKTYAEAEDFYQNSILQSAKLENGIDSLVSQLSSEVCPTCRRPYSVTPEDISRKQLELTTLRSQLKIVSSELNNVRKELQQLKKYRQTLTQLSSLAITESPPVIQTELTTLFKQERQLAQELEQSQLRVKLTGKLENTPVESELDLEARTSRLLVQVNRLKVQTDAANFITKSLLSLKALPLGDLEDLNVKIARLDTDLRSSSQRMKEATQKVSTLRERLQKFSDLTNRKAKLTSLIEDNKFVVQNTVCLKALTKALSPQGLQQLRFRSLLEDATLRTIPTYSNLLWPNGDVSLGLSDIEGSLQFQLNRHDAGITTNSSYISGGERRKAGLAFLFGMRDLKEMYTGSKTNILIIDEPFGDLDPQGTEHLLAIFQILKRKFTSIFVISHRPEVMEHPNWDQVWWAIRENNNATLHKTAPPARYKNLAAELVKQ